MFQHKVTAEEISSLPKTAFPGKIKVIDEVGPEFDKAIRYLRRQQVIGFDTETRPCFTPHQPQYKVALLQLSGKSNAYLFRINRIGMHRRLCSILADRKIIKVGAAVHDDILGLCKHRQFKADGFVDLQSEVYQWGIDDKSVKKMSAIVLGIRVSKTQQLSNWEADTLSEEQQLYAATDAWVCREIYFKLQDTDKLSHEEIEAHQAELRAIEEARSQARSEAHAAGKAEDKPDASTAVPAKKKSRRYYHKSKKSNQKPKQQS